ncbi:Mo-dependent nitrogenase [Xenococcus sp. PCC 7305]|uniref:Mo-dependent nitrogenase C-terminal domain-containing protein n=1 Tax=Xenococcus sp. PCC 7305 TaxID=102125 RepID=UPI0002AD0769|nr:Mo-dependent nitrogenase C-terminal domain-containing protein [Xenococcus sp. PCC 7305]ELS02348.1 Mo-dependent nitrogenase [Xenococcus sp. PCC 7305]
MSVKNYTASTIVSSSWVNNIQHKSSKTGFSLPNFGAIDLLKPLRSLLNDMVVQDPTIAHRICAVIPTQCPFARDVKLFGRTILRIPPLCKLNPLYDELVGLRFRAICYLADECGEDVSSYC